MKYREYRLYTGMCCWTGYIGAVRGAVTAVVSQGSRIFPALVSRCRKLPRGTDFTGILQDVRINTFTKEC